MDERKLSPSEELAASELELKKLELEEKKLNLLDLQDRINERSLKKEAAEQSRKTNGATLRQIAASDEAAQKRCNHRKGGQGMQGVMFGQGDDPQYAVIKHKFGNGDIWIRCQRCGKTWKPPIKDDFYFLEDGRKVEPIVKGAKFNQELFEQAQHQYTEALNFQTRNQMSSGNIYSFPGGVEEFRKKMRHSNLR
jgi:hypothetical protein